MANFCDFEFRVIGKKKAVKAFYESTPYLDWKDVEYEYGTASNYEMHFKGNCKWSINFDVEDDCDGVTADLSEETGVEYVGYSVRAKSEIFKCEVKVHYWSMKSEFDQFDHYKNGECLKKRKIAFDNYGEEENFDWDTLEFIGHEGEYDESVDGEQSDLDFMNRMSMMPGVIVPSQKPKKKANSAFNTLDVQDSWSIDKEIELRHNVFSKATFDEIVEIAKKNFSRAAAIYQLAELDVKGVISLVQISGQIGASHGREANNAEKNLISAMLEEVVPSFFHQVFWRGIQEPFGKKSADVIKQHLDSAPQLAPSILDIVFCFIYSDGKVEKTDIANLKKLASILSSPMSINQMSMPFGETTILHPVDYATFVSAVDNDTVAYMAGGDGFMTVNFDAKNVGVRKVGNDLPKIELSNEEIDTKILSLLKSGEKYSAKELRNLDYDINALSPQKLSAALRRMTQNGSLIKSDENGDSYYYAIKALYDKTVKAFNSSKRIEKFEELLDIFSLLGEYAESKSYADRCREKINQIHYDVANQLMTNAKSSGDMKKAVDIFNNLGDYKDSKDLYAKSTEQMECLADEESRKKEEKRIQEEKRKEENQKLLAALNNVAERFCANEDGFAILTLDGQVKTYNCPPQMSYALSKWKNIKSIRLKVSYKFETFVAVGLKYDGSVVSFAQYDNSQSEFDTSTWTDIVQIDVGYMHAVGLKRNGTVVATGNNAWDRCCVSSWKGMQKVVASTNGTIGLQTNGQIKIVGNDKETKFSCKDIVDVGAATFVYALTEDGKLYEASPWDRQERSNKDWGEIAYISKNQSSVKCCTAITKDLTLRTEAINYDKVISKWNNIVGGGLWSGGVIGVTADGYLKFEVPGKVIPDDIKNERLFYNFMTIEEDCQKAIEEAEKNRVARIKAEIEDLEKQMLEVKGLFAGFKKKSLQKKIDALKDQI